MSVWEQEQQELANQPAAIERAGDGRPLAVVMEERFEKSRSDYQSGSNLAESRAILEQWRAQEELESFHASRLQQASAAPALPTGPLVARTFSGLEGGVRRRLTTRAGRG